jgi:Fe-S oxidoreductase
MERCSDPCFGALTLVLGALALFLKKTRMQVKEMNKIIDKYKKDYFHKCLRRPGCGI